MPYFAFKHVGNIPLLAGGVTAVFLATVCSAMAHTSKSEAATLGNRQGIVASLIGGLLCLLVMGLCYVLGLGMIIGAK